MFCFKKKRYQQGGATASVEEESRAQNLPSPINSPSTDRPSARTPPRLVVEPSSDAESLDGRSRSASCTNATDVAASVASVAAVAVADAAPSCPDSSTELCHSGVGAAHSLPGSYPDSGPPSPVSTIAKVGGKQRGRSLELPGICVHCLHYETWLAQNPESPGSRRRRRSSSTSSASSTDSGGSRGSSIISSRSHSDDSRESSDDDEGDIGAIMADEEDEDPDSAAPSSRNEDATTDDSGRSTPNPSPSSIGSSCGGGGGSGAFLQVSSTRSVELFW